MNEEMIIDPATGGKKASKLARFDLVPPEALWALAEHYGKGAQKYEDRNWEKGYRWGLSLAALLRHLNLWQRGEPSDPETGTHHLTAVMWHAVCLYIFELRALGTDDVRRKEPCSTEQQINSTGSLPFGDEPLTLSTHPRRTSTSAKSPMPYPCSAVSGAMSGDFTA